MRTQLLARIGVASLMAFGLLSVSTPIGAVEYDCESREECWTGFACEPLVLQGSSTASSSYGVSQPGASAAVATAAATVAEREITTHCTEVDLTAYLTPSSEGYVTIVQCSQVCSGSSVVDVFVENVRAWIGAYCIESGGYSCSDDTTTDSGPQATLEGIQVDVPYTAVITENCAYANVYVNSVNTATDDECDDTVNYIGLVTP